jgi:orotate phosphoribosyltransferase
MACPLSISILRKKRGQISGVIVAYEERLREAQRDLAHVGLRSLSIVLM